MQPSRLRLLGMLAAMYYCWQQRHNIRTDQQLFNCALSNSCRRAGSGGTLQEVFVDWSTKLAWPTSSSRCHVTF